MSGEHSFAQISVGSHTCAIAATSGTGWCWGNGVYGQLEDILFGPNGDMPLVPIYWYTNVSLQRETIKDTFDQNLLDQVDLSKVVEGDGPDEVAS